MIADRYKPTGGTDAGGMGEILECLDTHLNRRVIIKSLQKDVEERRLIDEQRALAKLRSKHVVQLYDFVKIAGTPDPKQAIVLEYIDGKNLEVRSFEPNRAYIHTLWQIACGLRDIHALGVIHRDIKPNNIRLDREGVIKIIDFGLARFTNNAKTRNIIGTPNYMAPELWSNNTISFDSSIDVYAFGVTALALLKTSIPSELVKQPPGHISFSSLKESLQGVSEPTVTMLCRCLAKAPTHRPKMGEVVSVLQQQLIANQHRALVVFDTLSHHLDSMNSRVHLDAGNLGSLGIEYDGYDFTVVSATGDVFFNNAPALVGNKVPGCCVITFGSGTSVRKFVTFDVSTPEVMP